MPHITTCSKCGQGYEESSEENANHPTKRLCWSCFLKELDEKNEFAAVHLSAYKNN